MESLDDLTKGWIIGIIEGEGCFGLYEDKRSPGTFSLKIQVESTDKDVIEKLQQHLGGRVWESNYPSKFKAFPNAKPSWRWGISSKKKAKPVLELIYPFLSIRRKEQAKKLMDHIDGNS